MKSQLVSTNRRTAFIIEPVVCNLGFLIPSKEFVIGVRDTCRKHGRLFVMDEVATEFGRTGKMFASADFKVDPDVLCLAKAITAGFAPIGATLVTKVVATPRGWASPRRTTGTRCPWRRRWRT